MGQKLERTRQQQLIFDPPSSGPKTSKQAAERISGSAASLRRKVLEFIRTRGARGATDSEIQDCLEMDGDTERPRRWELRKAGLIVDSGIRRETKTGRASIVWRAAQ